MRHLPRHAALVWSRAGGAPLPPSSVASTRWAAPCSGLGTQSASSFARSSSSEQGLYNQCGSLEASSWGSDSSDAQLLQEHVVASHFTPSNNMRYGSSSRSAVRRPRWKHSITEGAFPRLDILPPSCSQLRLCSGIGTSDPKSETFTTPQDSAPTRTGQSDEISGTIYEEHKEISGGAGDHVEQKKEDQDASGSPNEGAAVQHETFISGWEHQSDERLRSALKEIASMIQNWELETKSDYQIQAEQEAGKLARERFGILDEWNLDEWNAAWSFESKQEVVIQRVKKVYGLDKYLPPKVTAEFTEAKSITDITSADVNKLFRLSEEDQARYFPEGLPQGLIKEFQSSEGNSVLIRRQVLKLIDHLKRFGRAEPTEQEATSIELLGSDESTEGELTKSCETENMLSDPTQPTSPLSYNARMKLKKQLRCLERVDLGSKKHILLDGLPGSGKSIALAMLVLWARTNGWLVFYVPSGRGWTHGAYYYKNEVTGLWDTPVEALSMLENVLKSHGDILEAISCRVFDSIPLGEGPGVGLLAVPQLVPILEGSTLKDLIQFGLQTPHAAVGVVVRLRKELSLVNEVPVLIAIDEFNSWFTFSQYHESIGEFGRRPIHARELAMVHAYRDMTSDPIVVGAFSHSTNVGKLPKQLPAIPHDAKVFLERYDFYEASLMLKYYQSQLNPREKMGKKARRKLYVLTNGNAAELRQAGVARAGITRENQSDLVMW